MAVVNYDDPNMVLVHHDVLWLKDDSILHDGIIYNNQEDL